MPSTRSLVLSVLAIALGACGGASSTATAAGADGAAATPAPASTALITGAALPFTATPMTTFDTPWAMAFLPDGRVLVTEKAGALRLFDPSSKRTGSVSGVPKVDAGGQGGLGDVVLHPQFATNRLVYLSYAEAGPDNTRGAVVARATLVTDGNGGGALQDVKVIWAQTPKVDGRGHYGHRIAFDKQGKLWISSGERQKFDPAQDMASNLGKILRLNDDGSVPKDNPFAAKGGVTAQIWSLGHRNPLGLAFDDKGRLWDVEMGPKGGDELNLVQRGGNYGYPVVSNGDHYDGRDIPDHPLRPEFSAPKVFWNPAISPSSLSFYSGSQFPQWKSDAFIGGLSSLALVRIRFDGNRATEAARYGMGARIRDVKQGPDGALWVLEDGSNGRLLKLTPKA